MLFRSKQDAQVIKFTVLSFFNLAVGILKDNRLGFLRPNCIEFNLAVTSLILQPVRELNPLRAP